MMVSRSAVWYKIALLTGFLLTLAAGEAYSQGNFSSNQSGNWSNSAIWTLTGGVDGDNIPDANDNVIISAGHTVTVNVAANATSVTLSNAGAAAVLTLGADLSVSGNVTLNDPANASTTNQINVGAFTLTVGGTLTVNGGGGAGSRLGVLSIGTGTVDAVNITVEADVDAQISFTGAGFMFVSGTYIHGPTSTFTQGTVIFDGAAQTIDEDATYYNLTLSGSGTKSLNNVNTTTNVSNSLVVNAGITLELNSENLTVGDLQGSGTIQNNSATRNLTVGSNNASTTFSGVIQNAGGVIALVKNGTGTLELSGNNSYSGITTINAGTIRLGASGTSPNSPLGTTTNRTTVVSGATLDLNGFTLATAEPLTLNGTGVGGAGALINSSATGVSYSGLITLGSNASVVADAGGINLTNTGNITGATFGLTLGGTGNGSLSSAVNTTSGAVTKAGTGRWTVSGNSTYTGLTTISAGTLRLGGAGSGANTPLGTVTSGTTVSNGAVLDLNGFNLSIAEALTVNGTGIASGGALTNSSVTNVTYSGLLTLASSSSIVASAGTISLTNIGTISGAGFDLTLGGSTGGSVSSIIGTGTGRVLKEGAGTWTLSGSNTFTGGVIINAGTLQAGNAGAMNSGAPNELTFGAGTSGVFRLNGFDITVSNLNSDPVVGTPIVENGVAGTRTLTVNTSGSSTYEGILRNGAAGTLALTKSGTGALTLNGNNSYTGTTTLSAGTLNINSGTAIGSGTFTIGGGVIDNTSGGAVALSSNNAQNWNGNFTFTGTNDLDLGTGPVTLSSNRTVSIDGGELTVGGVIGGAFSVAKSGAGALTLNGANTLTGFTLNAGTINIGNTTALGAASGTLTINGGTIDNTSGAAITTPSYPINLNA
ncbi:MAG TPA: autotransporter-associated beta strand repeat-containing protein, partial [Chryseosolibacter sp.]|nr:autotransporter-associated beta strand repeat-containing protein [Chryseosolibacter sp.]